MDILYSDRNMETVDPEAHPIVCGWNSPVLCPGTALLNVVASNVTDTPDQSVAPYYRAVRRGGGGIPGWAPDFVDAGLAVIIEGEEFAWVEEKQLREVRDRLSITTDEGAQARTFLISLIMFSKTGH